MANADTESVAAGLIPAADLRRVAYSTEEAAEISGLSRAYIYAEWHAGRGPRRVKAGKRTLITDESLKAWLRSLEVSSDAKNYALYSRSK